MRKIVVTSLLTVVAPLLVGCGAEYAPYTPEDAPSALGTVQAAVAACEGDDLQYDFNAFTASLAVAIANEMGRWDVMTDFELSGNMLQLSQTGRMLCGDGCPNVEAVLALQLDASSVVPYHSPSIFRDKLAGWYAQQELLLVEGATANSQAMGTFRFVSKYSNKRMTASDSGSEIKLYSWTSSTGADEWEMQVSGGGHNLVNVRTGKCMDLQYDSAYARAIQADCNDSDTQRFEIDSNTDGQHVLLQTKHGKALEVQNWSMNDGTSISQGRLTFYETNKLWRMEQVGQAPQGQQAQSSSQGVPNGMFSLVAKHSGKAIGVEGSSFESGGDITARSYRAGMANMEWYVSKVGGEYQLINRHSRLCLELGRNGGWETQVSQQKCENISSQLFSFHSDPGNGEEHFGIRASNGSYLNVQNWGQAEGTKLVVSGTGFGGENTIFRMDEILAGEPHELKFSHVTNDGPCGDYYWYEISQPNGLPLASPEQTFQQLAFAGGKTSLDGDDENPFIAQQTNGTLVAIDPSSYMNTSTRSSTGSCIASDIMYDRTGKAAGKCCIKYNGKYGSYVQSYWSRSTYLCK